MAGSNPPNSYFILVYIFENEKKLQKNRFFRSPKILKLTFGNSAIYSANEGRLELVQLAFMKKRIKKLLKRREEKIEYYREKVWFCLTPNFKIQQKSKNSRMGKGKGLIERHTIRVRRNLCIFEFVGVPDFLIKKVIFRLNKKLNIRLELMSIYENNYNFWSTRKKYINYHNKYMIKY